MSQFTNPVLRELIFSTWAVVWEGGMEINRVRTRARAETKDSTEPFFRMLQILEHMKDWPDETPIPKQREMGSKPVLQMGIRVPLAGYYGR